MSTTTQFTTFADLYNGLLKAMRTDSSNSATVEQAKRYINTAHLDIHLGFAEKVPWAIRDYSTSTGESFLATIATVGTAITSGTTGIITQNYTIANPTTTAVTTPTAVIVTNSVDGTTLGIEGITASIAATDPADMAVVATTGTASGTTDVLKVGDGIRLSPDELYMPTDFMRLAGDQIKIGTRLLDLLGRVEFRHRFAGETLVGRPNYATLIDSFSTTGGVESRKIRLFPLPNTTERVFISYVTNLLVVTAAGDRLEAFTSDTDQPLMPLRYRHAIFFHALYNWYRDRKDDTRSQEAKGEYVEIMSRIVNDTEAGQSHMSIRPNVSSYRRKASRPYRRGGSRRYDFGRFDRLD